MQSAHLDRLILPRQRHFGMDLEVEGERVSKFKKPASRQRQFIRVA